MYGCVGVWVTCTAELVVEVKCTGVLVGGLPAQVFSRGKAPGGQVETQCPKWRSAGGGQEVQSSALPVVQWRQDAWHPGNASRGVNITETHRHTHAV